MPQVIINGRRFQTPGRMPTWAAEGGGGAREVVHRRRLLSGGEALGATASVPYYEFGYQRRSYPFFWAGRPGGVPSSRPAAESRELGLDLEDAGKGPYFAAFPGFAHSEIHQTRTSFADWPPNRPSGPEPLAPREALGFLSGMSDNERRLALLLAAGGLGYLLYQRMGRPARGRLARATRRYRRR